MADRSSGTGQESRRIGVILENQIKQSLETQLGSYQSLVKYLYDNPELGNEEFLAQAALVDILEQEGFTVKKSVAVATDFIAVYDTGKPGPTLAYMCEYDALPSVGHGCGHNLIAAISLGAGCALKSVADQTGGIIQIIGTPAEENFGGKVSLAQAGVFKKVDAAMMLHPSFENGLGGRSMALIPVRFQFHGKTAHGTSAWEGASALDGAVSTYNLINQLRQFVKPCTSIHGVFTDGGKAANVIPDFAQLDYYFRATTMAYAKEIQAKAEVSAKAAAMAAGVTVEASLYETAYDDCLMSYSLGDLLEEAMIKAGLTDIKAIDEDPKGSTDVGAVSYQCPTVQGKIKICDETVAGHSRELADATISPVGSEALFKGAYALALLGLKLLTDPQALTKVKAEFQNSVK